MSTLRQGTIVVVVVVVAAVAVDRGKSFVVEATEEGNGLSTAGVGVPTLLLLLLFPLVRSLGPGGWPVKRVMIPEKRLCLGGSAAVDTTGCLTSPRDDDVPRASPSLLLLWSSTTLRRLLGEYRSSQKQHPPIESMAARYVPVASQLTATTGLAGVGAVVVVVVVVALGSRTIHVVGSSDEEDRGRDEGQDN